MLSTKLDAVVGENKSSRVFWRRFLVTSIVLVIASYIFLSYWDYSEEYHEAPAEWSDQLAGHAYAPVQYRIGVVFVAGFLQHLSHGHIGLRYGITLIDFTFLAIALPLTIWLVSQTRLFLLTSSIVQRASYFIALALLVFDLTWTFWYHKPETIANYGCLAMAFALLAVWRKIPPAVSILAIVVLSLYSGTIRADSGLALNLGIFVSALLGSTQAGRGSKVIAAVLGGLSTLGVEFYIKHVLFPHNPFSDPLFQLVRNLKNPVNMFCVIFALWPYYYTLRAASKHWQQLKDWEQTLVVASAVEFLLFVVVAKVDEVRLFLPYVMVLVPTTTALLCRDIFPESSRDPQGA